MLLRDYALKGEDVHSEDPVIDAILMMAKPNIKAATDRYNKSLKGGDDGWRGGDFGIRGGRPRRGETKEEAYERRRALWNTAAKEQETTTPVEPPQNPQNPLNENVDVNVDVKGNGYAKDYSNVKDKGYAKDYVDEKDDAVVKDNSIGKGDDFLNGLIINDDFDEYDEDYSVKAGTASAYLEGQVLQEQERFFRSNWETDDYI